ncbi:galactose mutarotase [Galbibacter sp. EGI 63066]|uniref:aldose epimerase family protein n=1 Tax=Galbibacter sp. EGI 63066 TaxID=2993559 RepID=UPI00224886A6|nr:aldose epimerase family protein [Galbibacter sp. EGI 63066]MCX2680209.1 galactose mutarotase [Galbibacter sp. EGI 63066]
MKKYSIENQFLKLVTLDYGATVHQLITKDKNGNDVNVVMGYENLQDYVHNAPYMGASVGRCAGRINGKGFRLNDTHYPIYNKDGAHLHGGKEGFSFKTWEVENIKEGESITFSYLSEDMEEGYPGTMKASVTYRLKGNQLVITYQAESDRDTIVNLTNHNYYNLNGAGSILEHELYISAENILEKSEYAVSTGNFIPLENTYFDFREERKVGSHNEFNGIDDCYQLTKENSFARLYSEKTGIEMRMNTNQPGVVVYTPPQLDETKVQNNPLADYPAICFETQNFPDAPNHSDFPSAVLKKGETYKNESVFEFNVR